MIQVKTSQRNKPTSRERWERDGKREREPISRNRSDWPILFLSSSSIPLARSFGLCAHYWPFDGDPFWTIVQQSTMREKNIVYCGTNLAYFLPPKIESILFWISKNEKFHLIFLSKLTDFLHFQVFLVCLCVNERVWLFLFFVSLPNHVMQQRNSCDNGLSVHQAILCSKKTTSI